MSKNSRRYTDLRERLIANSSAPTDDGCWYWTGKLDRWGYAQINVYVPGLKRKATLKAHIALWCWAEAGCKTADDLYLAYKEQVCSGLHLDHLCRCRGCIRLCHLESVTAHVNQQRRALARRSSTC